MNFIFGEIVYIKWTIHFKYSFMHAPTSFAMAMAAI